MSVPRSTAPPASIPRALRPLIAAPLLLAAAAALADAPEIYEFEVPMGPVCVDGAYPVSVHLPGAALQGTLSATTDVAGRLSGTLDIGGSALPVSGRVRHRADGSTLTFSAGGGRERLSFRGVYEPGAFAGTATGGKASPAPGKNPGDVDVGGASPQVATLTAILDPGGAARITGVGEARVCGDPLDLSAKGKRGQRFVLDLKTKGFRWRGSGEDGPDLALDWSLKGYGARVSGAGLPLEILLPPSDLQYPGVPPLLEQEEPLTPAAPVLGGGAVRTWSVEPALPDGLLLDPGTGVLSGTPVAVAAAADHVVRATNAAGFAEVTLPLAVRINRAYSLAPHGEALTDDDLRHFLVRTHFGIRGDELAALQQQGLPAYLDGMLDFTPDAALEAAAHAYLVNGTDPPGLQGGFPSSAQISRWWLYMQTVGTHPFRENLAMFWHDHFAVTADGLAPEQRFWMVEYLDLFRHGGAGNLRTLLLDVSRSAAMLDFLDGLSNTKSAPNENFAREFWELFTLGVDNGYTQRDITEAARAFTGYRSRINVDTNQYYVEFNAGRHDPDAKTILGSVIPPQNTGDDYAQVVDITLANRPAAEFICGKLLRWYCYDDPPDGLVADMAAVLRGADYELAPALRAMFLSEAFLSKRSRRSLTKSPVDFAVGFVRSTGLFLSPVVLDGYLTLLGQRVSEPPTVDGWPAGSLWFSAAAMVDRTNLAQSVILDTVNQARLGINVADVLPPVDQRSAVEVVQHLGTLLRADLTAADQADLVTYLNTVRNADGTVSPSPFDGSSQTHLDERVRGLLYVLAQHPAYHVR